MAMDKEGATRIKIIVVALVALLAWLAWDNGYFSFDESASNDSGRPNINQKFEQTLANPVNYTEAEVGDFGKRAYTASMTITHPTDLDSHMEAIKPFLSKKGFTSFKEALQNSRILETGNDVSVNFLDQPMVEPIYSGNVPTWKFNSAAEIIYSKADQRRTDKWDVTLIIVEDGIGIEGLAIEQAIAAQAR